MRIEERQSGGAAGTSNQILGEIRDFCRATHTAESTFGRLVVNDGKLVSRLRDGAKITTGTLDKVRAYLSEHRAAQPSPQDKPSTAKAVNGAAVATDIAPAGFRFCCSSRPAARRPRSPTGFRSSLATCNPRRPRFGCSMPASAMAPCCRG